MRAERGVTLVELLVVIAIIAALSGMIVLSFPTDREQDAITRAAIELRNTMRDARARAMAENKAYALTFNITNPGDGRVMRNFMPGDDRDFPGRHWYAIIGPAKNSVIKNYTGQMEYPPMIGNVHGVGSFNDYREIVRDHQIGPRHYLPRGVRFLALSDHDGGATLETDDRWHPEIGPWGRDDPNMLYPIPWFGSLVERSDHYELFGWGFLAPTVSGKNQAAARWGADYNAGRGNDSGIFSAFGAAEGYGGFATPEGYQIAEGELLDAYMLFTPDGRVAWVHRYRNKHKKNRRIHGSWKGTISQTWTSQHLVEQTGGFHITLARDVDPDDPIYHNGELHQFATEADALRSILPLARVYIHQQSGATDIRYGPSKPGPYVNWVESDGTVHSQREMGPTWWDVHRHCWIQQHQALYHGAAGDTEDQRAYHDPDNPYMQFKPARTW